jgi:hypothetical protein
MKHILHFSVLIVLLNGCFLFSPKPTSETNFCGSYVTLNSYAGFIRNCDATEFLESAIAPSALMRKDYVRQNRPLYIVATSCVGYGIYYVSTIFEDLYPLSLTKCMYIAYVFLNFSILLFALYLFDKISKKLTNGKISYEVILMLSVFIVSNFMTKAFFWTAHQQMFAFVMPLLSVYICTEFVRDQSIKVLYVVVFLLGVGMLIYGSFIILFVVCMLYLVYLKYISKTLLTVRTTAFFIIAGLLFVAPTLMWIFFLKMHGVVYYNHEVARYRQIVWMLDALLVSPTELFVAVYYNVIQFASTVYALFLFVGLLVITFVFRLSNNESVQLKRNFNLLFLNLVCFAIFFILLGYYANRLTFTLMPILLCLCVANLGSLLDSKKNKLVLLILVCVWHAYNVFSFGPFS